MNRTEGDGDTTLQKIQVTCRTCGVTESYYSNLSVDHFKLTHRGHDVTVVGDHPRQAAQPQRGAQARPPPPEPEPEPVAEFQVEPVAATRDEPRLDEEGATRLAKVVVDSVMFPALSNPVLRIRGFTPDLELAFVVTSSPGNPSKIRDVLARGEHVDHGPPEVRYVWDPAVIEFEEGTREKLGLPPERRKTEPVVPPEPEDTVAKTNAMLFGPPRVDEAVPAIEEPPMPAHADEEASPPPAPEPAEATAPPPLEKTPSAKRSKKKAQPVAEEPPRVPEAKDEYLLVSKSWYVQGGNQNRQEAVRVSKVLKEFRWKVEPVYTIGVMLDDLLSIETSKNEITRPLIERIEGAGYRLTAVVVEQGKPVAWFKRNQEDPPRVEHAEESAQPEEPGTFGILDLTQPAAEERGTT